MKTLTTSVTFDFVVIHSTSDQHSEPFIGKVLVPQSSNEGWEAGFEHVLVPHKTISGGYLEEHDHHNMAHITLTTAPNVGDTTYNLFYYRLEQHKDPSKFVHQTECLSIKQSDFLHKCPYITE